MLTPVGSTCGIRSKQPPRKRSPLEGRISVVIPRDSTPLRTSLFTSPDVLPVARLPKFPRGGTRDHHVKDRPLGIRNQVKSPLHPQGTIQVLSPVHQVHEDSVPEKH